MNTGNVSKQTMDEYIDTVFKEIKAKVQKAKLNLNNYSDVVAEAVFEQYEQAKKEQDGDSVTVIIGIQRGIGGPISNTNRLQNIHGQLAMSQPEGILVSEKLPTKDTEYVRKRLANRLKDLNDLKDFELTVIKDKVILNYWEWPDQNVLKHFVAKTGVSAFAQKGIKSQALPSGDGIRFIVNRESEE